MILLRLVLTLIILSYIQHSAASDTESLLGGDFSGQLTMATDYVFRGESETADGEIPAIQTSLTWTHKRTGIYAGVFGSTNKFTSTPDIYAVYGPYIGHAGELGTTGLDYNVFVFAYRYPGSSESNYSELWMKVSKTFDDAKLELEVTPTLEDWFGVHGWKGVNYALYPSYQLHKTLSVSGSVGYQDLNGNGAEGWVHWNLGMNWHRYGLLFDLRYHDSNIDSTHQVYGSAEGQEIFDQRLVIGVSKSF